MFDMEHFEDEQNNYSFHELIGKGAFGNVYKATDNDSRQDVAIKVQSLNIFVLFPH